MDFNGNFDVKPFFIISKTRLNSIIGHELGFHERWNRLDSLYWIPSYTGKCDDSFEYKDIYMFYEDDDLFNKTNINEDEKGYFVVGYKKPQLDIFEDVSISTWEKANTFNQALNAIKNFSDEKEIHIFGLSKDVNKELCEKLEEVTTFWNKFTERNCFDLRDGADNTDKEKVHMEGDIIITDPCYLIKKIDESTRPKWIDFHPYKSIYE